jgi:hypothetical protein
MRKLVATLTTVLAAVAVTAGLTLPASAAVASPQAGAVTQQAGAVTHEADPGNFPVYDREVNLRVTCGSFTGLVLWGGQGSIAFPAFLDVSGGTVRSSCNSTTYVYVGYHWAFASYESRFGKAGPGTVKAASFSTHNDYGFLYGDIYVEVCSNRYGWHCDRVDI